jgi:hypothetical protein
MFVDFNTTMALAILTEEREFVKAVGMKMLKVISTEITVFQCDAV